MISPSPEFSIPTVWCYSIWGHEELVHVTQVSHVRFGLIAPTEFLVHNI